MFTVWIHHVDLELVSALWTDVLKHLSTILNVSQFSPDWSQSCCGSTSVQTEGLSSDRIQTECFDVKIILQMIKQTRRVEIKQTALIKDPAELKLSVIIPPQNNTEHFPHVTPGWQAEICAVKCDRWDINRLNNDTHWIHNSCGFFSPAEGGNVLQFQQNNAVTHVFSGCVYLFVCLFVCYVTVAVLNVHCVFKTTLVKLQSVIQILRQLF